MLHEHRDRLMAVPGVVGVALAQCDGVPCIRVLVREATPRVERGIPRTLGGHPVEVQVTGEIRARDE